MAFDLKTPEPLPGPALPYRRGPAVLKRAVKFRREGVDKGKKRTRSLRGPAIRKERLE